MARTKRHAFRARRHGQVTAFLRRALSKDWCAMKLFLSGFSAFEYWTSMRLDANPHPTTAGSAIIERCAHTNRDVLSYAQRPDISQLSWPIDVLIPQATNNLKTSLVIPHRCPERLPKGALRSAGRGLYVSSPELCFLQLARDLPLHDLALVGFELCGAYALNLQNDGALVSCNPATTKTKLQRFLESCHGATGVKRALRAARLVLDGSCSPMESKVALLLSANSTVGGFGLPLPELNTKLTMPVRGHNLESTNGTTSTVRTSQTRACDLLWRERGIAIEYDSTTHHEGRENIDRDARRRNQLVSNGLTVLTVTRQHAQDFFAMESIASDVRMLLGRNARPRSRDVRVRQWRLHRALFGTSVSPAMRLRTGRLPLPRPKSAGETTPTADA